MHTFKWWILACLMAAPAAYPHAGSGTTTDNVTARLVGETAAIGPGQSIWIALELNIRDGWHTYWRNPGDSGEATKLTWSLPPGFTAGDIVWTTPHRFELSPLVNYGYSKHAVHLVQMTAPTNLAPRGVIVLKAKASWLVCADVCVPEDADLQLVLPTVAGTAEPDPTDTALFAAARGDLPAPEPAPTAARIQDGTLVITLGKAWGATLSQITSLSFFPYDDGGIEYAAPQTLTRSKDSLELAIKTGYQPPQSGIVRGVMLAAERSGDETVTVPLEIAATLATAGRAGTAVRAAASTLPSLILLAVVGGLILNLMPCVFPVLSIKAIGLVEDAKIHPAAVRAKGLVFAAGVVTSMLGLAIVLLALRAGGEQIGWGFQLQSPLFVTLMIYLLLAVGLNLSGVFDVGGGLEGVGDELTRGNSYRASFFTGVLTTLVATPCTAPFMAAAVGAALTQSPVVALILFAAIGVGLSLPYLLLSFAPWTRRALPKPGAWMETLKQVFAFPMYASAAWLLWVLAQQTSSLGLGAALTGTILISLAAWSYQRSKLSGRIGRTVAIATAVIAVPLAIFLPARYAGDAAASPAGSTASAAATAAQQGAEAWQPYDAAQAAEIESAGRPLLINFTASWCLTCLVNERNAFADKAVQEVFRAKGVVLMKGDWTSRDASITKALSAFGRAGVPLYVVYNSKPGTVPPVVLPQLLTAASVQEAFAQLPDQVLK